MNYGVSNSLHSFPISNQFAGVLSLLGPRSSSSTPHNPIGKVFSREELEKIAAIAEEFNLLVMSDEVVRKSHLVRLSID